jgi:hypothetical protein
LINLVQKSRKTAVQLKVALALESLSKDNLKLSRKILELGAAESMISLLKVCFEKRK